jgi:hypothetical protein
LKIQVNFSSARCNCNSRTMTDYGPPAAPDYLHLLSMLT